MLAEVCGKEDRTVCVVFDERVYGASPDCETVGVSVKSECVMCVSGEDGEGKSAGSDVLYLR